MPVQLFHSEVYRKKTYTIKYNGYSGYDVVVYLSKNIEKKEFFGLWFNARDWAYDCINEFIKKSATN